MANQTKGALGYTTRSKGSTPATLTFSSAVGATSGGTENITFKNILPGMIVNVVPRTTIGAGLIMSQPPVVTAKNTLTFYWYNPTGAPITPTAFVADIIVL